MKTKKFIKWFHSLINNTLVKIIFYILVIVIVFLIYASTLEESEIGANILDLLLNEITLSFFIASLISLICSTILHKIDVHLEESLKIEDNHHKIINRYKKHPSSQVDISKNYFDKTGGFMELHHLKEEKNIVNPIKDKFSSDYKMIQKEIDNYLEHNFLKLPTINIFANILGNTELEFEDIRRTKEVPSFILENSDSILKAHRNSRINNSVTVRLNDVELENDVFKLKTERSNYYYMLLTNRCMDYTLDNGMTVRDMFEYDQLISPLNKSQLGNQIGINGVVITSDGYLLLEKRDNSKTTWKNKFAQPISLALKDADLILNENRELDPTPLCAEMNFKKVLANTLKINYGLVEDDFETLSMKTCFLGLARDLLEGGKPNLYFAVTTKCDSKELLVKLRHHSSGSSLTNEKLLSDYYLIHFDDIKIDFNYTLKVDKNKVFPVDRLVYPRVSRAKERNKKLSYKITKFFDKYLEHEVGEALLVCLSYLEICQERFHALNKGVPNE